MKVVIAVLVALVVGAGIGVLDPFCGSGNTGKAARSLGRRALLADIAPGVAARRLRLRVVGSSSA